MENLISIINRIRNAGIARLYFVAWVGSDSSGTIEGSFVMTHSSWMPDPSGAYRYAVEHLRGKHGTCAIKQFNRLF